MTADRQEKARVEKLEAALREIAAGIHEIHPNCTNPDCGCCAASALACVAEEALKP